MAGVRMDLVGQISVGGFTHSERPVHTLHHKSTALSRLSKLSFLVDITLKNNMILSAIPPKSS